MLSVLSILTIFISAFLLFQVQPLAGKMLLPLFGGASSVWITCMFFFQTMLLVGYGYAHFSFKRLSAAQRLKLHTLLLTASLFILWWYFPTDAADIESGENPVVELLLYLTILFGVPFVTLSATAPLVQGILGAKTGGSVYRLYAVSNFASFLALLSYPAAFEVLLTLSEQRVLWSVLFLCYSLCMFIFLLSTPNDTASPRPDTNTDAASRQTLIFESCHWSLYSATGCLVLLSATNHLCQNIASIPFLWIVPLSLYLLSFIVTFSHERFYSRFWSLVIFFGSAGLLFWSERVGTPHIITLIFAISILTFSACMICHGELAKLKPPTRDLTRFYFTMSFGSVLGSGFVILIAPMLFQQYSEGILALCCCAIIGLTGYDRERRISTAVQNRNFILGLSVALALSFLFDRRTDVLFSVRNFYGILMVKDRYQHSPDYHHYVLMHGEVVHGLQFRVEQKRKIPTTYYGETSGIGRVLLGYKKDKPRRIGVVGLGVGTVAAYGTPDDALHFYEINPAVVDLASDYFSFLSDSAARVTTSIGDGRLLLEKSKGENFDILLIDAFSSDAIPVHLLTQEAFQTYANQLSAGGVLVFHITNFYVDLVPIVVSLADHFGFLSFYVKDLGTKLKGQVGSDYLILCRSSEESTLHTILNAPLINLEPHQTRLWTDSYSNLLLSLRLRRSSQ